MDIWARVGPCHCIFVGTARPLHDPLGTSFSLMHCLHMALLHGRMQ